MPGSITLTPAQQRAELARAARRAQRSNAPEDRRAVATLRAEYATAKLAEYVAKVVGEAPPLTPEQRDRIAVLLCGGASV